MRVAFPVATACAVLAVMAACAGSHPTHPSQTAGMQLDRLDITQPQVPPQSRLRPVGHVVVRNRITVNELYLWLEGFPAFAGAPASAGCPVDYGIRYHIVFSAGNTVVLSADANPSGCQDIRLSDGRTLQALSETGTGRAFWALLAQTVHRPLSRVQGRAGRGPG
jgi:hypothetical protein